MWLIPVPERAQQLFSESRVEAAAQAIEGRSGREPQYMLFPEGEGTENKGQGKAAQESGRCLAHPRSPVDRRRAHRDVVYRDDGESVWALRRCHEVQASLQVRIVGVFRFAT